MKAGIIEQLGQGDLLLPSLIAAGLAANDRVKTRLSVLQAAAHRAREPISPHVDLAGECRAVGLEEAALETLVNRAAPATGERMSAPGLGSLGAAIWDDMAAMIRAVRAGNPGQADDAAKHLAAIQASTTLGSSDDIDLPSVARLTGLSETGGDSLHRLIMELHKALNRLAASHAEETIAGAQAYALLPDDRSAVEAFMRGVAATEKLKFEHPGLGTTATRAAGRLTIQNDIGETNAHVVVITVEADAATILYTDVHLPRAKFFVGLFRHLPVQWSGLERKSAIGLADDGAFYLITGRYPFDSTVRRNAFLENVGASLVFLIDWNKARKVLREWVANADAVHIIEWAARHRVGHRAFLQLGGAELVGSAVRHAAPSRIGFGERLDRVLGRDAAVDFLKTVLRIAAEALLQGSSVRLARDRIEAALVAHLQRVDRTLLAATIRQAGLAHEIAADLAHLIAERRAQRPFDCTALAERARRVEEKADRLAIEARGEIAQFDAGRGIERLVNQIEDAIDELEQAAFVASLVPDEVAAELLDPLAELCAAAVSGTEAAAIGVAAAAEVPDGHRVDLEDALAMVGRLIDIEHRADAAERTITAQILTAQFDQRTALSVLELARALERSTDRLAAFGHLLREHVLADLVA